MPIHGARQSGAAPEQYKAHPTLRMAGSGAYASRSTANSRSLPKRRFNAWSRMTHLGAEPEAETPQAGLLLLSTLAISGETVRRFGGFIAKYMGDGVLIYFGYPQAREDDAERAVRAGLELIAAVAALQAPAPLQTRVGIATGLVVVGDLIGSGSARERPAEQLHALIKPLLMDDRVLGVAEHEQPLASNGAPPIENLQRPRGRDGQGGEALAGLMTHRWREGDSNPRFL
jgi:hypothetical protein